MGHPEQAGSQAQKGTLGCQGLGQAVIAGGPGVSFGGDTDILESDSGSGCTLCCCAAHLPSRVRLFVTLWAIARWAPLSFTVSQNLLRLVSIELVMPSNITLQLYKCTESH